MRLRQGIRGVRGVLILGLAAIATSGAVGAGRAEAEDWRVDDAPIAAIVDREVDEKMAGAGVWAAPEADDATIVRRLTLDLAGRIPTPAEARAYADSADPDKRARLVDRLMATPGFARQQADAFDAMLMAGVRGSLRDYLARAFGEGRTWDAIFRDLILADESEPGRKGSAEFIKTRARDLDRLTADVGTLFFGVNVSCAKCHDHPRVDSWTQDLFYGMKSFVGRTFVNAGFVGEHDYGRVAYKTVEGEERRAKFRFLDGREADVPGVDEPTAEERKEEKRRLAEAKSKKAPPPAPRASARAKLVAIALEPESRDYFARAIVNRLWHRYFGVGLVMPLDQMHAANPPSHPELLDRLARDLVAHDYDLRRLVRGLVLSRTYARASRLEPASASDSEQDGEEEAEGQGPDPRLFAVATLRPLSPSQLALSMCLATSDPVDLPGDPGDPALEAKVASLEGRAKALAVALARPGEDYQIGAPEALLFSNGASPGDLLSDGDDRLVGLLVRTADRRRRIEIAVRTILSRPPDDAEVALLDAYLAGREDRPVEACRQLVWSLLTGSEFRFNH